MTEYIINEDYTIDLDTIHIDAHCPYCENEAFINEAVVIVPPDDDAFPDGIFENVCTLCAEKSVWMERAQYKIVV